MLKLGHAAARCILAAGVMFLLGCGGDGITIVPVEGTVTLDGQPLERIMVEFWPESEGPRSFASTDEQGHFVLTTDDGKRQGAALGTHRITLKDMTVYNDKFLGRAAENMTNNSSGKKNRIAALELRGVMRGENQIAHASKARIHRGQRLAGIGVGRNGNKFKLGMAEYEANELGSGISSRADDSNLQRHIRLLVCDLCTDAHFAAVVMKWVETLAPKDA